MLFRFLCAGLLVQAATGQTANQASAGDAESALRQGTLAQEHGDLKTAIADFRKALDLNPNLMEAHANLGAALAASGQLDAAIEEDNRVLELAPQNDAVRTNLAMAYYRTGNLNQARVEFEKLHAAHPADLNTAILLGYTYNKLGREGDAAALLAPLEPGHEDDFRIRVRLCLRADRVREAGRRVADAWRSWPRRRTPPKHGCLPVRRGSIDGEMKSRAGGSGCSRSN